MGAALVAALLARARDTPSPPINWAVEGRRRACCGARLQAGSRRARRPHARARGVASGARRAGRRAGGRSAARAQTCSLEGACAAGGAGLARWRRQSAAADSRAHRPQPARTPPAAAARGARAGARAGRTTWLGRAAAAALHPNALAARATRNAREARSPPDRAQARPCRCPPRCHRTSKSIRSSRSKEPVFLTRLGLRGRPATTPTTSPRPPPATA